MSQGLKAGGWRPVCAIGCGVVPVTQGRYKGQPFVSQGDAHVRLAPCHPPPPAGPSADPRLALGGCGINGIPTAEEQAKAKWSDVLNQYQRRSDLIPNLVETVKGYAQQRRTC